jgi:UDP:flavonoid glycosyltransferase YjiC (YdhE family)
MGITQKALAAGVPVCAIPFGRDQFEVARRVAVTDAGVMLSKSKLSAKRVREAVAKAPGAQRVAASFEAAGGASAAADAMEQLLTGHRALDPA